MKPCLTLLALVFFLTGCIPLRQYAHVSGPLHPSVGLCDDRYLLVEIDMNREKIVDVLVEHAIIDRRVVPGSRNR